MTRSIVAGNWKMNGTQASVADLVTDLKQSINQAANLNKDVEWVVFPSFPYISQVITALKDTKIAIGAQTVSAYGNGAYTGEVSATMLQDLGCKYVLLGHSERRQLFHACNETIKAKLQQVRANNLSPILCVGETLEQRKAEKTTQVIQEQLDAVLDSTKQLDDLIIAYEPVWAIGTGEAATAEQAETVHAMIREHLTKLDPQKAAELPLLYGGSVKPSNAESLFVMPNINGGLIGGASLDAQQFLEIGQCIKSS